MEVESWGRAGKAVHTIAIDLPCLLAWYIGCGTGKGGITWEVPQRPCLLLSSCSSAAFLGKLPTIKFAQECLSDVVRPAVKS